MYLLVYVSMNYVDAILRHCKNNYRTPMRTVKFHREYVGI